jgi:hypothetical protein
MITQTPYAPPRARPTEPGDGLHGREPRSFADPAATRERTPASDALPGQITYPLTTRSGRELSVSLTLKPVFSLAKGEPSAVRLVEEIRTAAGGLRVLEPAERARLDLIDIERLDCEAYHRGLKLIEDSGAAAGVIPTSYRTLARAQGRFAYLSACLQAPVTEHAAVFAEITDVDAGTPRERLAEVAALIGTHRRGVMVRLDRDPRSLPMLLADLNVAGAVIDAAGLDAAGWPPFRSYLRAVRSVVRTVLLDRLDPTWSISARDWGATHAVFAPYQGVTI